MIGMLYRCDELSQPRRCGGRPQLSGDPSAARPASDRGAGLTPARLSALSVLVFGGPCSLGRLAKAEDVAGPTMTRIVDGLVDLGLAERKPHPDGANMVL